MLHGELSELGRVGHGPTLPGPRPGSEAGTGARLGGRSLWLGPAIPGPGSTALRELREAAGGRLREAGRRLGLSRLSLAAEATVPERVTEGLALNRVCRPDAWEDPEWMTVNRALSMRADVIHRKAFEWTQCVYGLERLGVLGPETRVLGVGAGREPVLYYLANRSALTVATDLYEGHFVDTPAAEADPDFLSDPAAYAPFPYRRERLAALPSDGRALPFPSSTFDVVYSLSSIEHFGGHAGAAQAMREMPRVLRPGGIGCLATELLLEGDGHFEFFTREELNHWVVEASGLVPVERLDDAPPSRDLFEDPVVIPHINRNPHIVLGDGDLRWTSSESRPPPTTSDGPRPAWPGRPAGVRTGPPDGLACRPGRPRPAPPSAARSSRPGRRAPPWPRWAGRSWWPGRWP